MNEDRATVEHPCEVTRAQEFRYCEAVALDPVSGRQINRGISRESAICDTADHTIVVRFSYGPSGLLDLASEELVERRVLCRIRFDLRRSVLSSTRPGSETTHEIF